MGYQPCRGSACPGVAVLCGRPHPADNRPSLGVFCETPPALTALCVKRISLKRIPWTQLAVLARAHAPERGGSALAATTVVNGQSPVA